VATFDLDGHYLGSTVFGTSDPRPPQSIRWAYRLGDGVLVRGERFDAERKVQEDYLAIYGSDGARRQELHARARPMRNYALPKVTIRERESFFAGARAVLGGDGRIYVAPDRDAFHIEVFDLQGALVGTIAMEWPAHERGPKEIEATKREYGIHASPGVRLPELVYEIEPTAPIIRQILWVEGSLWVEVQSRIDDPEHVGRYAILDGDGALVELRDVVVPGVTAGDRTEILSDSRIVVTKHHRAAMRARFAGANMKVGEGREEDAPEATEEEEGVYLVVFTPRPSARDAPASN
jgi:hypothetical protein